jgi:hypothetical protein
LRQRGGLGGVVPEVGFEGLGGEGLDLPLIIVDMELIHGGGDVVVEFFEAFKQILHVAIIAGDTKKDPGWVFFSYSCEIGDYRLRRLLM